VAKGGQLASVNWKAVPLELSSENPVKVAQTSSLLGYEIQKLFSAALAPVTLNVPHLPPLQNQRNTSSLLAAKDRRERIEIQCLFFALFTFFCG
jgi:hypothetical protein